ncbi:AraC family transcriptional regulator [Flavobacterium sp. J27]|uniref:helix-turn-helix domain-containing protein n=1 Tax=Flavobacterium sp. J27 TaxID=2060419 RepID=UPI001030490E|nr:helix-turn-helix transcriptional regulator [Flavobacterium sp. J27]
MKGQKVHRIKTIQEFYSHKGIPAPAHPLISLFDYSLINCTEESDNEYFVFDFYHISIKKNASVKYKYGQSSYDFDNGVMFFVAPNQVFGTEQIAETMASKEGWLLLIHPNFLWNTSLAKNIKKYDYFDYAVNEALFLSEKEEAILNTIVKNIEKESHENLDKFSQSIIVSQIETLLNYSERFYQRQFLTRNKNNHKILSKTEKILNDYFAIPELSSQGLPTVQYVADMLHLSPIYLSSLLKSITGQSTQQIIHEKLIEKAKEKLTTTNLTISEIAYELGFEHAQSFSKLFKTKTNFSPIKFRQAFN